MTKYSIPLKNVKPNYKKIGCKKGDIFWETEIVHHDIKVTIPKYKSTVINRFYRSGELGCAHPLSNQEYQYMLNQ